MDSAVEHLRHRGTIVYTVGVDPIDDLFELDERVFAARPDLILRLDQADGKTRFAEPYLEALAAVKHVAALELNLQQRHELNGIAALERLEFLKVSARKQQSLDFIRGLKSLRFLSLSGKFDDLSPIADCRLLNTLLLSCTIETLDFAAHVPSLEYLSIDSCVCSGSLSVLADSGIRLLRLSSIRNLTNIDDLAALRQLEYVSLSLSKVERLCDFSAMDRLKQLELNGMKGLRDIGNLWTAARLESLELREIGKDVAADEWQGLTRLAQLRQVDFRWIDFGQARIAALHKLMSEAGKAHLVVENIPEEERIPSMGIAHLSRFLL